jgi:hypothetical protein
MKVENIDFACSSHSQNKPDKKQAGLEIKLSQSDFFTSETKGFF